MIFKKNETFTKIQNGMLNRHSSKCCCPRATQEAHPITRLPLLQRGTGQEGRDIASIVFSASDAGYKCRKSSGIALQHRVVETTAAAREQQVVGAAAQLHLISK
jgi:hypothetical protein